VLTRRLHRLFFVYNLLTLPPGLRARRHGVCRDCGALTAGQCADVTIALDAIDGARRVHGTCSIWRAARLLRQRSKPIPSLDRSFRRGPGLSNARSLTNQRTRTGLLRCTKTSASPSGAGPGSGVQGWSEKEGVIYVQPPVPCWSRWSPCARTLRLRSESGPLRVVPRSHRHGRLSADAAKACASDMASRVHRPSVVERRRCALYCFIHLPKREPDHARRVLHFLFGHRAGMRTEWHNAV